MLRATPRDRLDSTYRLDNTSSQQGSNPCHMLFRRPHKWMEESLRYSLAKDKASSQCFAAAPVFGSEVSSDTSYSLDLVE
jgi:hypothetical protein